jgi:hypothetical protein
MKKRGFSIMAKEKKLVEAITSMDEDFARWYTDVCVKADLIGLHQRKGLHGHQAGRLCDLGKHPEKTGPPL